MVVGDVYALLVEWCHGQGNMQQTMQLVEQMLDRHVPPGHYLSPDVLAAVQQVGERCAARLLGRFWQLHITCVSGTHMHVFCVEGCT